MQSNPAVLRGSLQGKWLRVCHPGISRASKLICKTTLGWLPGATASWDPTAGSPDGSVQQEPGCRMAEVNGGLSREQGGCVVPQSSHTRLSLRCSQHLRCPWREWGYWAPPALPSPEKNSRCCVLTAFSSGHRGVSVLSRSLPDPLCSVKSLLFPLACSLWRGLCQARAPAPVTAAVSSFRVRQLSLQCSALPELKWPLRPSWCFHSRFKRVPCLSLLGLWLGLNCAALGRLESSVGKQPLRFSAPRQSFSCTRLPSGF